LIISIASGKGGTGKTTIAVNLALSLEPKVQFLDCDVEEPNAHLFLRPVFNGPKIITTPVPYVDENRCTLCGKCAEICQFRAIVVIGKTVLTFPELCHSCGGCLEVCPEVAITEIGRELGILEKGHRDGMDFIHARLRVGEAMSPPLISQVRSLTKPDRLTIIDAPPGTSCPVIMSMKNTDFVLLVTEPTPFGLHDLKLAFEAVRILDIPCGLVINRSDIGDNGVSKYALEKDLPVLMEIPFDRQIAESYSKGEVLVEIRPEWKGKFKALYQKIENILAERG
jgi:MinD superfamily P-loop ATPase